MHLHKYLVDILPRRKQKKDKSKRGSDGLVLSSVTGSATIWCDVGDASHLQLSKLTVLGRFRHAGNIHKLKQVDHQSACYHDYISIIIIMLRDLDIAATSSNHAVQNVQTSG